MKHIFILLLLTLSTVSFAQDEATKEHINDDHAAHAVLLGEDGSEVGHAHFQQGAIGTLMTVKIDNLPEGAKGFHVHSVGTCEHEHGFKTAEGHVGKSDDTAHGFLNENGPEKGDLPNLYIHEDGTNKTELFLPQLNVDELLDEDGSSLMIHENADDHMTQPIGGAGARIACGVIEIKN